MDLNLSESTLLLKNAAREFLAAECPPSLVKQMERDEKAYPAGLWKKMVAMGWPGIMVAEEYGGHDGGFLNLLALMQEIGRAAVPSPFFSTVWCGLAIMEGGSDEQKRALLPRLCSGESLISPALSEAGVDFGLDYLNTTAIRKNDRYVVSGTKLFVPDAHVAESFFCVTAAPDLNNGNGIRALLVGGTTPGVSLVPLNTQLRDREFEVCFTDAEATEHGALGGAGCARSWLERALDKAMVAKCGEMIGLGRKILEMTVEYAAVREQFGKPIGTLQAIQHHCANLATCVETAELMTYRAAWMIEQGLPCRREALHAKAWTNEACKRAAALSHQVHGGIGFTLEYDLYLYTARITSFAHCLGGTDWCHERIAHELLGTSRHSKSTE